MPALTSNRVAKQLQRKTAEHFYTDTATYITRTAGTPDNYGQPTYTETTASIACSFTDTVSREDWRDLGDIQEIDAEIRFSSATTPNKKDAITITARFDDSSFTDKRYHIVGIKNRGPFGYVCALKAVDL